MKDASNHFAPLELCARAPARSAFTLIELIITVVIAAIAVMGLITMFKEALTNMERQRSIQSAALLTEDLLSEIRSKKFIDPLVSTNFGPEPGETNRALYNDVDDYNGWSDSPPKTIEGIPMTNFDGFTWRTVVSNVPLTNFNLTASPACAPNSTDFKRITVVVSNELVAVSNLTVVGRYD